MPSSSRMMVKSDLFTPAANHRRLFTCAGRHEEGVEVRVKVTSNLSSLLTCFVVTLSVSHAYRFRSCCVRLPTTQRMWRCTLCCSATLHRQQPHTPAVASLLSTAHATSWKFRQVAREDILECFHDNANLSVYH
jgi:hypothetical protein